MLTKKEKILIPRAYEQIGDIILFSDFPKELEKKEKKIAEIILKKTKSAKVIVKKTKNFSGKYRLPKLKILAGENRKETIHKENGLRIKINPEKAYFSSKTGSERLRIAKLVKKNEKVLVMFSGVAPFNLTLSKHSKLKESYGIEINPEAHKYAEENIIINKFNNIHLYKGNVKLILPKLKEKFNRIIMPAPKNAMNYLKLAKEYTKKGGTIHFYTFEKEENFNKLKEKFKDFKKVDLIKTGQTSPRVYRICLDLKV
jgi:tRNA (guanine37-N1)-methyltransferase